MHIEQFPVEKWMDRFEHAVRYNLAETGVEAWTIRELLALASDPEKHLAALLDEAQEYGYVTGSPELRERAASLYRGGEPSRLLATHGAIEANFLALAALLEPEGEVVAMAPTYSQLYQLPRFWGAEVKLWWLRAENDYRPDLDELERLVTPRTSLIVLNNPNNPTGSLMNEAELRRVAAVAQGVGAQVLCDEVYRFLVFEGEEPPSFAEISEEATVTSSLSKSFGMAGLRLGWLYGPPEVIARARDFQDYTTIGPPKMIDRLACLALAHREEIIARTRMLLLENRGMLGRWAQGMKERVQIVEPRAGTSVFARFVGRCESEKLCLGLIEEQSVMLVPGECFGVPGSARLGFGIRPDTLAEGLDRMALYLKGADA